jgi:hypothetical protein
MNVEVNYLAVFLAAASSMVVGGIWYDKPVFGTTWARLAKLDDKNMSSCATLALVWAFLLSLLTAYILAHLAFLSNHFYGHSFFQDAVTTAFWAWLGLVFTRILVHNIFEQKPKMLNVLAVANEFVTLMVMGLILGWLHP